ncbi:chemotaxis protein CheB [Aquabacterium sp.]|uniref:chemotaxis protein CheB n=1 Tax=Aquabacterium sp. TaxID=1872578 RepID=UPI003D6CE218
MALIVGIGASTGGVSALLTLLAQLPADFEAPLLVVLHIGAHRSIFPELVTTKTSLSASHPADGELLRPGHVYVAPPDRHMRVAKDRISLSRGPKEHHSRPAIDPLFRSLALEHGPAAVGVVLTGMLDDGTSGLQAIKHCGGVAVVQDPDDAEAREMPESAMRHASVDHCAPLIDIPQILSTLARRPAWAPPRPPASLVHEDQLFLGQGSAMSHLHAIASPTPFVCPDCHGGLWELKDSRPVRYRCHTGHMFSGATLSQALLEASDEACWNAVRALQERQLFAERLQALDGDMNDSAGASRALALAQMERRMKALREVVEDSDVLDVEIQHDPPHADSKDGAHRAGGRS